MPASLKQTKGKRRLTGQVDFVALSRDLVDAVESGVYIVQSKNNGEIMWVMERVSPIEYMGGKASLGSFVDITQPQADGGGACAL